MKGFAAFTLSTALVCALTLVNPDQARWIALGLLGVAFVASAIPRRKVGER